MRLGPALPLILSLAGCFDGGGKDVATFLDGSVSADDFRERYARYLDLSGQRDNIVLRKEILNNIINERLILADLDAKGFETWRPSQEKKEQIRLQAILDRYSRMISTDTLTVTEEEFRREFQAFNSTASVRYLYAPSEEDAWMLKRRLETGASFHQLAPEVFEDPGLATNGGDLGSFGWGEMEPALEQRAFFLPVGEISDPFPLRVGYGIVRVESRVVQPLRSEYDYAKAKPALGKAILQRKTMECLKATTDRLAEEAAPVFEENAVGKILDHWDSFSSRPDQEGMRSTDVSLMPLVTFSDGSWTVGDFFSRMERTSERQRDRVHTAKDVRDVVTGLIVRERMLAAAIDAGLEEDPEVLSQSESVYYQYRLTEWRELVADTIGQAGWSEESIRTEFLQNAEHQQVPPEVNVGEILVRTLEEAERLAGMVRSGSDFSTLASQHSIRVWAGKRGGELGFGTQASYGVLGEKIFSAKPGSIIGPEFVDPYYGVFKILGRRDGRPKALEESRAEIIENLRAVRTREVFSRAVNDLRSRANIQVDETVLAHIVIENQPKGEAS